MKRIKAVFIDIDGTLTNGKKELTDATKLAIDKIKNKGIYVVLCSGRSNMDVCNYSKIVQASEYVISSNGAELYNYKTKNILYKNNINFLSVKKIWQYCNSQNLEIIFNLTDAQYGNDIFYSDIYRKRFILDDIDSLKDNQIYQIMINSNSYLKTEECINFITKMEDMKITNLSRDYLKNDKNSKEPYYIFTNNRFVDKGCAIKEFLDIMQIKKEEAICFGDRINDITMFNECGMTIAMDNADVELKNIANYVTLSNDENGVADFINKYM